MHLCRVSEDPSHPAFIGAGRPGQCGARQDLGQAAGTGYWSAEARCSRRFRTGLIVRGAGLALLPVIVVLLLAVMVLACGLRAAGRPRSHVGTRWSRSFVMPNRVTHSVHRPGAKEATSNEQLVTRVVIFITGNPRGVARLGARPKNCPRGSCVASVHHLSIGDPREMWSPGGPRRRRRLLPRTDQQDKAGVGAKRHGGGSPGRRTRPDPGPRPVRTSRSTRTRPTGTTGLKRLRR